MTDPSDANADLPPVHAQCASCGLSPLIELSFQRADEARWREISVTADRDPDSAVVHIDACPVCNAGWFDAGELDVLGEPGSSLEAALGVPPVPSSRSCPRGHGLMVTRPLRVGSDEVPVEQCETCDGLWLDGHERARLARMTTAEGQRGRSEDLARRGAIWALQLLTQLPVEVDNPRRDTPWIVYGLLALLVMAFGLQFAGVVDLDACDVLRRSRSTDGLCLAPVAGALRGEFSRHGLAALTQGVSWTAFTSVFLHGNLTHLLGNLYFLYIFGDNVESLFGRARFVTLFLGAGLVGVALELALTSATADPIVGASGGIAGIMAAYLWCFPRNKLFQMVLFVQLKLPAWTYLVFWIGFQAVMGAFSTAHHVAWFSHIGGFVTGLAITPWVLRWRRRQVAASVEHPAWDLVSGGRPRPMSPSVRPASTEQR